MNCFHYIFIILLILSIPRYVYICMSICMFYVVFHFFLSSDLFFFVPHGVARIVQLYGDNKGFDLICKQAGQTRGEMSRGKSGTKLQNKTQTLCVISDSFIESFSVLFIYVLRFFKFLFSLYLTRLVPLLQTHTVKESHTHNLKTRFAG